MSLLYALILTFVPAGWLICAVLIGGWVLDKCQPGAAAVGLYLALTSGSLLAASSLVSWAIRSAAAGGM